MTKISYNDSSNTSGGFETDSKEIVINIGGQTASSYSKEIEMIDVGLKMGKLEAKLSARIKDCEEKQKNIETLANENKKKIDKEISDNDSFWLSTKKLIRNIRIVWLVWLIVPLAQLVAFSVYLDFIVTNDSVSIWFKIAFGGIGVSTLAELVCLPKNIHSLTERVKNIENRINEKDSRL